MPQQKHTLSSALYYLKVTYPTGYLVTQSLTQSLSSTHQCTHQCTHQIDIYASKADYESESANLLGQFILNKSGELLEIVQVNHDKFIHKSV